MASLGLMGFALGLAIAATPGPLFFVCLRRTVRLGWVNGLVSGLGVATADGVYGALAAFGVAVASAALVTQRRWLALVGGVALAIIGLRALIARAKQDEAGSGPVGAGLARAFLSTFALTITNPATILSFGAAFAALGVGIGAGYLRPAVVVAGVLLGSATWWLVLATGAAALRARVKPALVRAISGLSGLAILAFGLVAVALALTGR